MKKICVFCGSSEGADPERMEMASKFGKYLGENNYGIVFGGGSVGLMGAVADACLEVGGKVWGVIPQTLVDAEVGHQGLTELEIVDSMHQRKERMYQLSDAFVGLPGGWGTFDEMFEIMTWRQLGLHQKPIALFNHKGYYTSLFEQMDNMISEGFVKAAHHHILDRLDEFEELLQWLPEN